MTLPTDISGLSRWYRTDSLSALTDNATVGTWNDESGYAAHLTSIGTHHPTYVTERWNGMAGVVFNGYNYMSNSATTARPSTDVTTFAVVAHNRRAFPTAPMFVTWGSGSTQGWNLFANTSFDADQMPPSMIALKGAGSWGNNQVTLQSITGFGRGDPMLLTGLTSGSTTYIRGDASGPDVDSSGDTGSLSYGASPVLMLGDKGPGIAPAQATFFEVLIYNASLSESDIDAVETYLDDKWKITQSQAAYSAVFNGQSGFSDYAIGLSWSPDAKRWKRKPLNPIVVADGVAGSWKEVFVHAPWLVHDGSQYRLYYDAHNASAKFQIGYSHSPDLSAWLDFGSNPVIALGGGGSIDEGGCAFPTVVIDEVDPDPTRRWKMWYGAVDGTGKYTIAYAYSSDGDTWTKYGRVLDVGSAGAWDAVWVIPGCIWRTADNTWYLFYQGRKNPGSPNSEFQGGIATFTDPEGTYTRYAGNPTLKHLSSTAGMSQAVTANVAAGAITVSVASTAAWSAHMPIYMDCVSATAPSVNRILTIDSATQITLEWPTEGAYTVADGGRVVPVAYNSVIPRGIRQLADGTFELNLIPFQPVNDGTHTGPFETLREMAMRATLTALTTNAVLDNTSGLFGLVDDTGEWDQISQENWSFLSFASEPPNVLPSSPYLNLRFKTA